MRKNLLLFISLTILLISHLSSGQGTFTNFTMLQNQKIQSSPLVQWTNISPGTSGYCEEFWCHPTDVNVMFSGADMHAAFGTWDNGQSWNTLKDSDGNGLDMRRVIDIQFSLQDADYGIAFANDQSGSNSSGKVYNTIDRGRNWTEVSTMGKCHSKLAIHPTNDNIWFLGAGDFWNVKSNHRTLAEPQGQMQSRSNYGYVWKTTNRGVNWTKVATGIDTNLDAGRIIFDRSNPNTLIMATAQGMYRSTNLGVTWTSSATGLPNNRPRDLTSYYNSTTGEFILYAVEQTYYNPTGTTINSTGGIYKSTDSGLSWQNITGNLGLNLQLVTDYRSRDDYHSTVAKWLGITKAQSIATYTTYPTQILQTFNRIVVNPTNKNEIYIVHNKRHDVSFGQGDVWKTIDGGITWIACSRSGPYWINNTNQSYWTSRNNPTGANIDFSHMQKYMDDIDEQYSGARMLAINKNGEVFAGINQQLLRSNNGGVSWEQADDIEAAPNSNQWIGRGNTNLPGKVMLLETGVAGRKLLCSGEHGLWKTTGTATSSPIANNVVIEQIEGQVHDIGGNTAAHSIATVAAHPTNPDIIYTLSSRQEHRGWLRRTTDGGQTWQDISEIFTASNNVYEDLAPQNSLLIDPNNPSNMYFCATRKAITEVGNSVNESILTKGGYGFYKSTDAGLNWTLSNTGLPASTGSIHRLTLDPANSNTIYAAVNQFSNSDPGGLYKSTNNGASWTQMTIPTAIKSVNNFFMDRNTGYMFISAGARSGELNAGGVWRSTNSGTTWTRIFESPYIWQTEVSPINSNIIVISAAAQVPNLVDNFKNTGVFLSVDGGSNWTKINKGLAHSERIVDVKPDPDNQNILWCAGWGSGWYKAVIDPALLSVEDKTHTGNQINVYPNPVGNNGSVKLKNIDDNTPYSIYDIQGKLLFSGNVSKEEAISVSQLNSGIYFIKVKNQQGKKTSIKFIVNK
ncbi:T9SS type A sorting domain-containing protein [Flavobacterium faecale]|uniref:T9SS type A sorting domain-containing protein n=1 Tax=Flavobacterium faecale TaxID=1355330 RepID=UPI001B86D49A|nr:T9SS type A sorting domain-containing protein [Flavobacterium faecale]